MNREIKFRAWDRKNKNWLTDKEPVYLNEEGRAFILVRGSADDYLSSVDVDIVLYTGLKDKEGVEIYEGDVVQGYWGWMSGDGRLKKGYPNKIRKWFEVRYETRHGNAGFKLHEIKVHPEDQFAADKYFYRSIDSRLCEDREIELKDNKVQWKGMCESLEVIGNVFQNPDLLQ